MGRGSFTPSSHPRRARGMFEVRVASNPVCVRGGWRVPIPGFTEQPLRGVMGLGSHIWTLHGAVSFLQRSLWTQRQRDIGVTSGGAGVALGVLPPFPTEVPLSQPSRAPLGAAGTPRDEGWEGKLRGHPVPTSLPQFAPVAERRKRGFSVFPAAKFLFCCPGAESAPSAPYNLLNSA